MSILLTTDRDGVHGELSLVTDARGGVLVLGGSGGGHPGSGYGPALAAAGWASLCLSYFDAPGLPPDLHEIPVEYIERALVRLRSEVPAGPLVVMARSRGTEVAQLLALRHPGEVAALVLGVPTYVVVQAWPREGAAWTVEGRPVPAHPEGWPTGPFPLDPPAVIALEGFHGQVLLVSGGADEIWPSSDFARAIVARRGALPTEHLDHPEARHAVGVLIDDGRCDDPQTVVALHETWPRVLAFLHGLTSPRPATPLC